MHPKLRPLSASPLLLNLLGKLRFLKGMLFMLPLNYVSRWWSIGGVYITQDRKIRQNWSVSYTTQKGRRRGRGAERKEWDAFFPLNPAAPAVRRKLGTTWLQGSNAQKYTIVLKGSPRSTRFLFITRLLGPETISVIFHVKRCST